MLTVQQVSRLTGVSIRALHHYDSIGLLKPSALSSAGYRMYDQQALDRLHSILLLRSLAFSLKEIRSILDSPDFDRKEALEQQIHLLELQKEHIEKLIQEAKQLRENGGYKMNFSAFSKDAMDAYAQEVKNRWGQTKEYEESQRRMEATSEENKRGFTEQMTAIFARFGELRTIDPASAEAQQTAAQLQTYITENFYNCTREIFSCLGEMYSADDRFRENIDRIGGQGTAEFASAAISFYCK